MTNLPAAAQGVRGPIGLGFRVPLLVVSPFSRGGLVCSDVFDHTSILRFLETRFDCEVPNLSTWRRSVTGDLTSAFNFLAAPDRSVPALPAASPADSRVTGGNCAIEPGTLGGAPLPPYPVPPNSMPRQEPGRPRRPSGCGTSGGTPGAARIPAGRVAEPGQAAAPAALRVSRHGALQRPHAAGSRGADPLRRRPGANRPSRTRNGRAAPAPVRELRGARDQARTAHRTRVSPRPPARPRLATSAVEQLIGASSSGAR